MVKTCAAFVDESSKEANAHAHDELVAIPVENQPVSRRKSRGQQTAEGVVVEKVSKYTVELIIMAVLNIYAGKGSHEIPEAITVDTRFLEGFATCGSQQTRSLCFI